MTSSAVAPAALAQGIARVLAGDLDDGDRCLQKTVRVAQETGGHQQQAEALAERSLLAMARGDWRQAEALADRASAVLRQAGTI